MRKRLGSLKSLILIGAIIIVWAVITLATDLVRPVFIPSPVDIWNSFTILLSDLPRHLLSSIGLTLGGFAIGVIVGIFLGLMMAYSRNFMDVTGPILEFTRPIPVFALIPLFLLWFGIGRLPQILLIALGVAAIIGVSTYEAIKNVPLVYIRAAQNLGSSKMIIFKNVLIPYMFPHLVGAIRVGAALSWGLDVAAEFIGAQVGLGYLMIIRQFYLDTAGIFVVVIIYSILAIGLDQIIRKVEERVNVWTERGKTNFDKLV